MNQEKDSPLQLTHDDLRNLNEACDDAITARERHKEQWSDCRPGEDVTADEERAQADAKIEGYRELKARFMEELDHCERCRKVAPLSWYDARHCYCGACIDELEALEAQAL